MMSTLDLFNKLSQQKSNLSSTFLRLTSKNENENNNNHGLTNFASLTNNRNDDSSSFKENDEDEVLQMLLSSFAHTNERTNCEKPLKRLVAHRRHLLVQLSKIDCEPKLFKFCADFETMLNDAKIVHATRDTHLTETGKLHSINKHLIPRLIQCEQQLKLYKLLRDSIDAKRTLEKLHLTLAKSYKKAPIDRLISQVADIRNNYSTILYGFNLFLLAGCKLDSPFCRYYHKLTEQHKQVQLDLLISIFESSLEQCKWPTVTTVIDRAPIAAKQLSLFGELFRTLLEMQTGDFQYKGQLVKNNRLRELEIFSGKPYESGEQKKNIDEISNRIQIYLPIKLMAAPLVTRFEFHFLSAHSKLNNLENPEWFLCQVEQWITRNEQFLVKHVDPILEEYYGLNKQNSKFQLVYHLLKLVNFKLKIDAEKLTEDRLFSLTLDEVIVFIKQIDFLVPGIFEYDVSLNPIRVFFDDEVYFNRFMQLERSRLNEFIESIFESDTSWNIVYGADFTEENKFIICEAADKFSLLLQNLIERSTFIPSSQYRICIVDLVLEIIDDFRLRLSQLMHAYEEQWPFSYRFYSILNTFHFFILLINEWQNNTYLIMILTENERDPNVLTNLAKTFEHMVEESFQRLTQNIIESINKDVHEYWKVIKRNIGPLISDSADSGDLTNKIEKKTVTENGANMIYTISMKVASIKQQLSSDLFKEFLSELASKLQEIIFERFFMNDITYSKEGASQLQYDMRHGLFCLFAMYNGNSEYLFSKISDALILLNCSTRTADKLLDDYGVVSDLESKQALRNIGVYSLHPHTAMPILEKRIGY